MLVVGIAGITAAAGLYGVAGNNKDFIKTQLGATRIGSYLLNYYRGTQATPSARTNAVSYSIFERESSWPVEDAKERAGLPEFQIIPGMTPEEAAAHRAAEQTLDFTKWERSNGNDFANKYSALAQINPSNVRNLIPAWTYHAGEGSGHVGDNPIVVNGTIYVAATPQALVAIDGATGAEKWRLKLPLPAKRGLLWWTGSDDVSPRLFVPTGGGVVAVDPATGQLIETFGENGRVGSGRNASLIAPAIDGNRLLIATTAPSIEAYDVTTGKFLWRTPLLKPASAPLSGPSEWRLAGGSPWGGMALDPARSRLYVSTGNPRPELYGATRPGRNEHSNSVVCIDTETGTIVWSFQEVAHDIWDFDVAAPPILVSVKRYGKQIDAVAAVTKMGNTLLLDRDSGKPLYDFRLRRAPVSTVPGEQTWPYQPDIETPEPFAKLAFQESDITDLSQAARASVEQKLFGAQYGVFAPPALNRMTVTFGHNGGAQWPGAAVDPQRGILYVPANHLPWLIGLVYQEHLENPARWMDSEGDRTYQNRCAACHGVDRDGHYDDEFTGDKRIPSLVGITASLGTITLERFRAAHAMLETAMKTSESEIAIVNRYLSKADHISDDRRSLEIVHKWQLLLDDKGYPGSKPPWGTITAIDLNTGKKAWQVPFGAFSELAAKGIPPTGQPNYGGLIATGSGLLFATGTVDRKIRAFTAATGEELWAYELPAAGTAPPATYEIDGTQYVAVVATGGIYAGYTERSDTIMAFKLKP